ncbi:MAG: hypothetical protein IJ829_01525 [Kiritimatiellae bacterium]|nr:hypothetical protein [Kiritimatiellia bacterium]
MDQLKEKEEKRSKREVKENLLLQRRAREAGFRYADFGPRCQFALDQLWGRGILNNDIWRTAGKLGMTKREVADWLLYLDDTGYVLGDGRPLTRLNFRRPMRMWHKVAVREGETGEAEAERSAAEPSPKRSRALALAEKPESWALCRERCKWAREGAGCAKGVKVPPDHAERPIPPEECPCFAERKANDE